MGTEYITRCCRFVFYGMNHSPEYYGCCRNCNGIWYGCDPVVSEGDEK